MVVTVNVWWTVTVGGLGACYGMSACYFRGPMCLFAWYRQVDVDVRNRSLERKPNGKHKEGCRGVS